MALTYPMHAVPGELLTTTENQEDVAYNALWRVLRVHEGTPLCYGDLLLVIACSERFEQAKMLGIWPTYVMHCQSGRIMFFTDITDVGWIFRPSDEATAWKLA